MPGLTSMPDAPTVARIVIAATGESPNELRIIGSGVTAVGWRADTDGGSYCVLVATPRESYVEDHPLDEPRFAARAEVLASLVGLARTLLLVAAGGADTRGIDVPENELPALRQVAQAYGIHGLVYLAELLTDCRQRVRRAAFPRVLVETTLVKLSMVGRLEPLEALLARLDEVSDAPVSEVINNITPAARERSPQEPKPAQNAPATGGSERPLSAREKTALDAVKRQFGAT